ncbi:MAG: phosphoribosylformylglycinamidine synthase I [Candidatus Bathyarchaeia archaeon]
MRVAVIRFPASNCDLDTVHALRLFPGLDVDLVWHRDFRHNPYLAIILPGGFSYGDYLRSGVIAAHSPAVEEVRLAADEGKAILGICNGFQILVEAELLPGALIANDTLSFVCRWVTIRVNNNKTVFTKKMNKGALLKMPVAHHEGMYFIDRDALKGLHDRGQIVFQYVDPNGELTPRANPNGSVDNVAGVSNPEGNVVGLMPHPERASERVLSPYGTEDGRLVFESLIQSVGGLS